MRMRYWDFDEDVDECVYVGLLVIGGLVREARLRRNLTQRQLAWATGISQSTISKLETGRLRGMRLRTLAAIIGVLRMNNAGSTSPGWHALGSGDREPPRSHRSLPGQSGLDTEAA